MNSLDTLLAMPLADAHLALDLLRADRQVVEPSQAASTEASHEGGTDGDQALTQRLSHPQDEARAAEVQNQARNVAPDTSSDEAIARALAEEEEAARPERGVSVDLRHLPPGHAFRMMHRFVPHVPGYGGNVHIHVTLPPVFARRCHRFMQNHVAVHV